jgi:hypothetical protein
MGLVFQCPGQLLVLGISFVDISSGRLHWDIGGNDITRMLFELLHRRGHFPYKDCDIKRMPDWMMMDHLKENCIILKEVRSVIAPGISHEH